MLPITVSESQIGQLERWVKAGNTPQSTALRSMIILESHRGQSAQAIGKTLQVSQPDHPALETALCGGWAAGSHHHRARSRTQAAD